MNMKMEDKSEFVVKRCKLSLKGRRSISSLTRKENCDIYKPTDQLSESSMPMIKSPVKLQRETVSNVIIDRGIATLPNLGNTCYMSSILQILRITPNFLPWLHTAARNTEKRELDILHQVFKSLTQVEMSSCVEAQEEIARHLKRLVELFAEQHPQYRIGQQFDAHEFLCWLVGVLGRPKKKKKKKGIRASRPVGECGEFVPSILEGRAESVVVCAECETSTTRQEVFWDLKIPSACIVYDQNTVVARATFNEETTLCGDDKYLCGFCLRPTEARHSLRVLSLPQVLVLHVPSKWQTSVPERLAKELPCIVAGRCSDGCRDPSHLYSLYAAVVHVGATSQFGHYVALLARPGGVDLREGIRRHTRSNRTDREACCGNSRPTAGDGWLLCDDERVDRLGNDRPFVDPSDLLGSSARPTILWYHRHK